MAGARKPGGGAGKREGAKSAGKGLESLAEHPLAAKPDSHDEAKKDLAAAVSGLTQVEELNAQLRADRAAAELRRLRKGMGMETPETLSSIGEAHDVAAKSAHDVALDGETDPIKAKKQMDSAMRQTNAAIRMMALEAEQERLEAAKKTDVADPASAVYAPAHAIEREDAEEGAGAPPADLPGASDAEAAAAVYAPAHAVEADEPPVPPAPPGERAPAAARPADPEEAAAIYQNAFNHPKYPKGSETPGAPEGGPTPAPGAAEATSAEAGPKSLKEQALEKQAELRELMLKTRGPEEVAKLEAIFGKQLRTSPEFFLKSAPMAERMLNAEQAYLAAYRQWNGDRHDLGVMSEQVWMGAGDNVPPRVKELREKWVQERAAYNGYLNSSAEVRYQDRENEGTRKHKFGREAVLERYNRIVAVRETVLGAEEAELRAKEMGLNERERGALGKLFDGYKKLPLWQRVLASSAILAGVGAATVLMGSGLGWVPLLMAGPSALLTWRAAAAKTPGTRTALGYAASITGVAGVFGLVGEGIARGLHGLFGTRKKAAAKLTQRAGFADLSTEEGMKEASKQRKKAGRAGERIARDARLSRTGAALVGGYEAGQMLKGSGLFDGNTPDTGPGNEGGPNNVNPGNPETPGTPEAPSLSDHDLSVGEIDDGTKINNADKLFGHFTENLLPEFPEGTAPPAIAKLYELMGGVENGKLDLLHGEDPLSQALNFESPDGKWSTVMHDGDTVRFHDGAIQFHHEGDAPDHWRTVIDAEGVTHPEAVADLPKMDAAGNIIGGAAVAESVPATTPEAPAAPEPESDVSIDSGTEVPEKDGVSISSGTEPKVDGDVTITQESSITEGTHGSEAGPAPADETPKPAEAVPAPATDEVPPPPPPPVESAAEAAIANPLNVDPNVADSFFGKGWNGQEQLWSMNGSFEDRFNEAQEYAFKHPGTMIRFDSTPPGGTPEVSAFASDATGKVQVLSKLIDPSSGLLEQPLGIDRLTRVAP